MGPVGREHVSTAPAAPKVVPARQQFEQNESPTTADEKASAKTGQYALSSNESFRGGSRAGGREFIDAAGSVHIVTLRRQSGANANDQDLKQASGGTLSSSGPRDVRLAALHRNNIEQEASNHRLQPKSGAAKPTPSRHVITDRPTQKKMVAVSQPAPRSIASRVNPLIPAYGYGSRRSVVFIRPPFGPPLGFRPGFYPARAALPLAFFRFPMAVRAWGL